MDREQAYKRVTAEYERRAVGDKRLEAFREKLENGKITLKEAQKYVDRSAEMFGEVFGDEVLGIEQGEREGACMSLMRDRMAEVNDVSRRAQKAVLARKGLNIEPRIADYPESRVFKIAHSLEDPGATDEQITRRAEQATATAMRGQFDDNMKKGAQTCAEAGLKTYIVREASGKGCDWCADIAGRYSYGDEPKDVYRRHDNCHCSVTYESGRGRQNVWTKVRWEVPEVKAEKPLTLTPKQAKERGAGEPKRLSREEAERLGAFEKPMRLTSGAKNDKIKYGDNGKDIYPPIVKVPRLNYFSNDKLNDVVTNVAQAIMNELKTHTDGTEIADIIEIEPPYKCHGLIIGEEGEMTVQIPLCDNFSITIHNHPSGNSFSSEDIDRFVIDNNAKYMCVIGNTGKWYILKKANDFDYIEFYHKAKDAIKENRLSKTVLAGADNYGFEYYQT